MYSLRSRSRCGSNVSARQSTNNNNASKQQAAQLKKKLPESNFLNSTIFGGIADPDTRRNNASTGGIKRRRRGEVSAKSSMEKPKKRKRGNNLRKTQKDAKVNKASSDKDMKIMQTIDKGNSSKELNRDYITKMPNEILLKIFSYLPIKELINVQLASPKLEPAAQDRILWKDFCTPCLMCLARGGNCHKKFELSVPMTGKEKLDQ